jgi:hypothetical protein
MNQKGKQEAFLKYRYLWLLHIQKKLILGHLLRLGSGSGPRRPDPGPTKKVQIQPDPEHWFFNRWSFLCQFSACLKYLSTQYPTNIYLLKSKIGSYCVEPTSSQMRSVVNANAIIWKGVICNYSRAYALSGQCQYSYLQKSNICTYS